MGRIKNVHIVAILAIVLVAFMTVGYAYVNQNDNLSSSSQRKSWNVGFNKEDFTSSGTAEDGMGPVISKNNIKFEVNFKKTGEYKTYTFEVLNTGDINAILNNVKVLSDSTNSKDLVFNYTVYKGDDTITSNLVPSMNKQFNHLYRTTGTNVVEVTIMYNGQDASVDETGAIVPIVAEYELDMAYTQAE